MIAILLLRILYSIIYLYTFLTYRYLLGFNWLFYWWIFYGNFLFLIIYFYRFFLIFVFEMFPFIIKLLFIYTWFLWNLLQLRNTTTLAFLFFSWLNLLKCFINLWHNDRWFFHWIFFVSTCFMTNSTSLITLMFD